MSVRMILILAGIALVLVVIAGLIIRLSRRRIHPKEGVHYIAGLNALIEGDYSAAFMHLRKAVREDPDNLDAYIKLGDILRETGKVENAIRVHKSIKAHQDLRPVQKKALLRSLVLDYLKAGRYNQGLKAVEELLDVDSRDLWSRQMKLDLLERKADWPAASQAFKDLMTLQGRKKKDYRDQLALYKVEEARDLFEKGQERSGRIKLREALKISANCTPAYLLLGDSYVREGRNGDALNIWKQFIERLPHQSNLVIERLRNVLFEMGTFSNIETILQDILARSPGNAEIMLALAQIYESKGDGARAVGLVEEILEKDPSFEKARLYLMKLYASEGKVEKSLEQVSAYVEEKLAWKPHFTCASCGYESDDPIWHCPNCGRWYVLS